jgi:outer membrane protein TolC
VSREYFDVLRAAHTVELARKRVAIADMMRDYAGERRKLGLAPPAELRRAAMDWSAEYEKLSSAKLAESQAMLRLMYLVGGRFGDRVVLADSLAGDDHPLPTIDSAVDEALANNPKLATLRLYEKSLAAKDSAIRAERMPVLSANGFFGLSVAGPQASGGGAVSHSYTYNMNFEVRLPLLDGHRRELERFDVLSEASRQRLVESDLKRQIELETRDAYEALKEAQEHLNLANDALKEADDDVEEAEVSLAAGTTSRLDLRQAEMRRAAAKDDRIAALYGQAQARLSLAEAMGKVTSLEW